MENTNKAVYKYYLNVVQGSDDDMFRVVETNMPYLAKVVRFAFQNGSPRLWAIVDVDAEPSETRKYVILGTGAKIPTITGYALTYRHTADYGPFVFHLFEMVDVGVKY